MLRPWDLNIQILRDSALSIHAQIAKTIIQDIKSGRLVSGTVLPGSRIMAHKIQVNRKTVVQAYEDLVAQGWLNTQNKRGTFVANRHQFDLKTHQIQNNSDILLRQAFAKKITGEQNNLESIEFSQGCSDPRLIPFEILSRAQRHAFIHASRTQNNAPKDPLGLPALRQALLTMLNLERGLHSKLNQICTLQSPQMALYIVAKALIKAGDYVIFEHLSHPTVRETFKHFGANILHVNHDNEGLDTAHLEQLCLAKQQLKLKIKAVYVTPNHHIPTTVMMALNRRKKLIELAERFGFMIIEHDEGFLYAFSQEMMPPIASYKQHAPIIYLASLSKAFSNSINLSFIVANHTFIMKCANHLTMLDQQSNQVTELAISEILHTGQLKKHLIKTHKIYEARRLHLLRLIQDELGAFVRILPTKSGLAFWLDVSADIRMDQLMHDLANLKIKIHAGKYYSCTRVSTRGLLMGFANLTMDEAQAGILRIKQAFDMQHST